MAKKNEIRLTQVKSIIGSHFKHKRTMDALRLRRMHQTVTHNDTPQIRGMINKVIHLIEVESSK